MARGKLAAYKQIRPDGFDISKSIKYREDQAFKYREEKRLIETQKKADATALDKKNKTEAKTYQDNIEKVYISPTGYTSHDEPLVKILQGPGGIFDTYSSVLSQLEKDPKNNALIIKKLNIEKSIENLKKAREGIIARGETIKKGMSDGTLSKTLNKAYADNYNAFVNDFQYDYNLNDNGTISILNKGKYDGNGDGFPDELTLSDIYNPEKMKSVGNFDVANWLKTNANNYGEIDTTTDANGFKTHQYKGFDPAKIESLNNDIDVLFGDSMANITDSGRSYLADTLKIDPKKPIEDKEFEKYRKAFAERVINKYDTLRKDTTNFSAKNAAERINNEKLKLAEKNKKNNAFRITVDGLLNGDEKYVSGLNNTRVGTVGSKYIEDADYTNGKLSFMIVDRSNSKNKAEPEQIIIDTNNKEEAIGNIIGYIKGSKNLDLKLEEYNKGKSDIQFTKNENNSLSLSAKKYINGWEKGKSQDIINKLNESGFEGFEDVSNLITNEIKGPNGKIYNVNQDKGIADFKEYLLSKEYSDYLNGQSKDKGSDTKDKEPPIGAKSRTDGVDLEYIGNKQWKIIKNDNNMYYIGDKGKVGSIEKNIHNNLSKSYFKDKSKTTFDPTNF